MDFTGHPAAVMPIAKISSRATFSPLVKPATNQSGGFVKRLLNNKFQTIPLPENRHPKQLRPHDYIHIKVKGSVLIILFQLKFILFSLTCQPSPVNNTWD